MQLILGPRRSGKTTKLVQTAMDWMWDNEDSFVWFLGFHSRWITDIKHSFRDEGLVGFRFIDKNNIYHRMRGISGLLLIDDLDMFTSGQLLSLGTLAHAYENLGCLKIIASINLR